MNNHLSQLQNCLLDTFKFFSKFCKENNITYFAVSGTLLGAIRHKGFIPWDDDIDVIMLRKDYDKLYSIRNKLEDSDFSLDDFRTKGNYNFFAKFYNKTKTFWEYKQFPYVIGPFIDIFPLDECNNIIEHKKLQEKFYTTFWAYRKCIAEHSWKEIIHDIITFNGVEGPIKLIKKVIYSPQREKYYNEACKINKEVSETKGEFYKPYWDVNHIQYPKEWFSEAIEMPFEDTVIMVPSGYHEILTYIFGDYMTPPPVHERTGHHTAYYMNLEKRLEIEEILRDKKDELVEKNPITLPMLWYGLKNLRGYE